jgi:uncharacterized protein YrrD
MAPGADLGPPVSYLSLRDGTPVYDRRGRRIGVVDEVAADTAHDIFEGLIIHTDPLPGRHLFASVERIAELRERGVLLSVESDSLPPARDARSGEVDREAPADGRLHALVRRTWDLINGR